MVIIGLDSADQKLIRDWIKDGSLPTFEKLTQTSAWGDSRNSTGMVAGTVWPTFYTGVLPGRTGRFRGTTQFLSGTYEHGSIDFERFSFPPFWNILAQNGKQCFIVDAPYAFLSEESAVTQIVDWCTHSPWLDGTTISTPSGLASRTKHEFGSDPVGKCDFTVLDTPQDFANFRDGLVLRAIASTDCDLFFNVFSECHCAGHQLWATHDRNHPQYDPSLVDHLGGDSVKQVYEAIDSALAEILDAVDGNTSVLIFCSHGIGPAYTGTNLLDEILMRIERKPTPRRRQRFASKLVALWRKTPQYVRTNLTPLQKKLWPKLKSKLVQPNKKDRRFFEIIINDASGGIRLNVKGREPQGIVDMANEYDELCDMLTRELLAVINPDTGKPLITRVIKTRELYTGENVDLLPDLMVEWSREGPISAAQSETIGTVTQKFVFANHRTGDHTEDDGLFFLQAPGVNAGYRGGYSLADLPPTITALLGCAFPDVDGRPIESIIGVSSPDDASVVDLARDHGAIAEKPRDRFLEDAPAVKLIQHL
jgi:predicted AlkP superfamily phosphohydrolase/phosphomutase